MIGNYRDRWGYKYDTTLVPNDTTRTFLRGTGSDDPLLKVDAEERTFWAPRFPTVFEVNND